MYTKKIVFLVCLFFGCQIRESKFLYCHSERVKKRSTSLKIRAVGIFPGAKVKRGPDWIWGDQDGESAALR